MYDLLHTENTACCLVLLLTEWEVNAGIYCPQPFRSVNTEKAKGNIRSVNTEKVKGNIILLLTEWEVNAGIYCPQAFPY